MSALVHFLPLACDGCWSGWQAWLGLFIGVVVLIGSIYALLASNLGARVGYLVLMISLFAWMMLLSAMWLFGLPGTQPGTGPRGAEPGWVPFTATSDQAKEFSTTLGTFPNGDSWRPIGTMFPGKVDSKGEFTTVRALIEESLARLAAVQKTGPTDSTEWGFRPKGVPAATPDEQKLPQATVAFSQQDTPLLFGVTIPASSSHPEVTVFAYRDPGKVYLYALYFLVISIAGFALHVWFLSRYETKQKAREAALSPAA